MRKFMIHMLIAVLAIFTTVGAAMAQVEIVKAGGNPPPSQYVTYDPVAGLTDVTSNGQIQGFVGNGPLNTNVTVDVSTLTPVTGPGGYQYNSLTGAFIQNLNGGNFVITDNSTHATLLTGTFGPSQLTGTNGSQSTGVTLLTNSVTYTGGSYFPSSGYSPDNGSLTLSFTSSISPGSSPPGVIAGPAGISPFTADDAIIFDAVPTSTPPSSTPEPASYATFGLGILAIIGLAAFAKRRSLTASL